MESMTLGFCRWGLQTKARTGTIERCRNTIAPASHPMTPPPFFYASIWPVLSPSPLPQPSLETWSTYPTLTLNPLPPILHVEKEIIPWLIIDTPSPLALHCALTHPSLPHPSQHFSLTLAQTEEELYALSVFFKYLVLYFVLLGFFLFIYNYFLFFSFFFLFFLFYLLIIGKVMDSSFVYTFSGWTCLQRVDFDFLLLFCIFIVFSGLFFVNLLCFQLHCMMHL